ncbi:hypothetical protein C5167_036076 [Papaver somniferum]|nr:hypothetical protein C5167_036076 [Papaver somniferum]
MRSVRLVLCCTFSSYIWSIEPEGSWSPIKTPVMRNQAGHIGATILLESDCYIEDKLLNHAQHPRKQQKGTNVSKTTSPTL